MGRETKILLGFLGLLAGVFVGVLSMKLLVPRPPAGAGPDVHADLAAAEPHHIVDPPAPTMPASAFAAAPPLVPTAVPGEPIDAGQFRGATPGTGDRYAARASAFAEPAEAASVADVAEPPRRDPFVTAASFQEADDPASGGPPIDPPPDARDADDLRAADTFDAQPPAATAPAAPATALPAAASPPPHDSAPIAPAGGHVARPGDTWWSLAERAYGDGRLYRALFAWNRAVDPRVTLAPGTPLQIPPLADLAGAWPHLLPRQP